MKKTTLKTVLVGLAMVAFTLIANSCGSTKKRVQEQSLQKQKETLVVSDNAANSNQNIKVESTELKDVISQSVTVKKTYTPIQSDKKAVAIDEQGKRVELENASLVEEITTQQHKGRQLQKQKVEVYQKNGSQTKQMHKADEKVLAKEQDKTVDRKAIHFSSWLWFLLIAIAVMVVVYLKYRFKLFSNVTNYFRK